MDQYGRQGSIFYSPCDQFIDNTSKVPSGAQH